jgi:hypothetical protein
LPRTPQAVSDPASDQNFRAIFSDLSALPTQFLGLSGGEGARIAFGAATVEFEGAKTVSKTATVTHGLGGTPTIVIPFPADFQGEQATAEADELGETTFQTRFRFAAFEPEAEAEATVYWLAIRKES